MLSCIWPGIPLTIIDSLHKYVPRNVCHPSNVSAALLLTYLRSLNAQKSMRGEGDNDMVELGPHAHNHVNTSTTRNGTMVFRHTTTRQFESVSASLPLVDAECLTSLHSVDKRQCLYLRARHLSGEDQISGSRPRFPGQDVVPNPSSRRKQHTVHQASTKIRHECRYSSVFVMLLGSAKESVGDH